MKPSACGSVPRPLRHTASSPAGPWFHETKLTRGKPNFRRKVVPLGLPGGVPRESRSELVPTSEGITASESVLTNLYPYPPYLLVSSIPSSSS
nr:hypothetical protein Q903MT_gene2254 [Picea sitchensis]